MAKLVYNALSNRFDLVGMTAEEAAAYVLKAGDTMTGMLTITPSGDTALTANKDIVLKAGQKLVFDGD